MMRVWHHYFIQSKKTFKFLKYYNTVKIGIQFTCISYGNF